jgi:hypothetical protein
MNSRWMAGVTPNKLINGLVGNDVLAARYGGLTHSGQRVVRAGQASLSAVASNIYSRGRGVGWTRSTAALKGADGAARAGGLLRVAGVGGSALATGFSAANVIAQGNPCDAFKENGVGYIADIVEVGFNASLTAAMVAPNPVTIGLAVGTGVIYGGLKIAEHWEEVTEWTSEAVESVGDAVDSAVDKGKEILGSLNPF